MSGVEKRKFPRIATGVSILYRGYQVDQQTRAYLEGVAQNVSLGGLFLQVDDPPPKGVVLELRFGRLHGEADRTVRAKAIVRWRRRWRKPRGVGIEFVEVEGIEREEIATWVASISAEGE